MKTFGLTVNLKDDPEIIDAYKKYHAEAWPEVVDSLRKVGIHEMKIWLKGRSLFMFLAVPDHFDPIVHLPDYLHLHPKCKEWEDIMSTFQEPVPSAKQGEKWSFMEEVFELSNFPK